MKTRRQYDEEFKKMAMELADAKGSLKATADELGIIPQILTRWRRERVTTREFPVETGPPVRMCKVLLVGRSSYYHWLAQRPTKRASENEAITQLISSLFTVSKGRYGSPKITRDLKAKGVKVSRPRVVRLMKQANLKSVILKKYVVTTTDSKHTYPVRKPWLNRQSLNILRYGTMAQATLRQRRHSSLGYLSPFDYYNEQRQHVA